MFARIFYCFLLAYVSPLGAAISIDGFSSATNDRFANHGSFILDGFDLSGVAIADSGRWVTMVSPNVWISANHFFPAEGTSVTFYATNDPNGSQVSRTIQASERISNSDIQIGTLNKGLPSNYAYYPYFTSDVPFSTNTSLVPNLGIHFGRSPTSWANSQDMAVGFNEIDLWLNPVSSAGTTDGAIATTVDSSGDANYSLFESSLAAGDSGAPLFRNLSGQLTIVGTNWFIGTIDPDNTPSSGDEYDVNGATYTGNYDTLITSYVDAHPVPEPAHFALILALLCLFFRKCRQTPRAFH